MLLRTTRMKPALIGLAAAASLVGATSALAAISSNVYIEASKSFKLGGGQKGAFSVRGQNRGSVTVEVFASADGTDSFVAEVEPGEKFRHDFADGEAALLRNMSDNAKAHVKVKVTGKTRSLYMGYIDN